MNSDCYYDLVKAGDICLASVVLLFLLFLSIGALKSWIVQKPTTTTQTRTVYYIPFGPWEDFDTSKLPKPPANVKFNSEGWLAYRVR